MPRAPKSRPDQPAICEEIVFRFAFTKRQQVERFTRLSIGCDWVVTIEYARWRPRWRVTLTSAQWLWPPDLAQWQSRLCEQARQAGGMASGWSMSRYRRPDIALEAMLTAA